MMGHVYRAALAAACIAGAVAARPAVAASVTTLDFVASARPDNDFLAASGDLAAAQGASARVQAFARRESASRRRVIGDIADWAIATARADRAADLAPTLDRLGQIFGPSDRVFEARVTPVADAEAATIRQLGTISGAPFDALFVASQTRALTHLVATYVDFIQNGDDETLRALAVHDLPRARALLAEVRRLR